MTREWRTLACVAAFVVGGILVVRVGFASFEQRQGWLAVLAMWVLAASGLLAWLRAPGSRIALLLVAAAAAWGAAGLVLGGLRDSELGARVLGLLYAPILGQAIVTFPSGRMTGLSAFPVAAGYLACLVPPPDGSIVVAISTVLGLALRIELRPGSTAASGSILIAAGAAFLIGIGLSERWPSLAPAAVPDPRTAVEAGLITIGVLLSWALVREVDRRRELEDLVLGLGSDGGDVLTRRLATVAGDPTLQIAYTVPGSGTWVDPSGRPRSRLGGDDRATTPIEFEGTPVGVLIHEGAQLTDPSVLQAVGRAAGLASANARLQAEVVAQLAEVEASRGRLAQAADDERRVLRRRLEEGLEPLLLELEVAVVRAAPGADGLDWAPVTYVHEARREIAALAAGLPPRALDRGLGPAIAALAARTPVPVTVERTTDGPTDASAQAALYFACSEALANAAKHARAESVTVRLAAADGEAVLEVIDDGVGEADPKRGTGLDGLRHRLEALGGSLSVDSPPGGGTRVRVAVPAHATVRPTGAGRATPSDAIRTGGPEGRVTATNGPTLDGSARPGPDRSGRSHADPNDVRVSRG